MDGANSTIKSLTGLTTALSIEQGGTGVVSKEAFRQSYNVPTKDESLLTENNLSDLADRAAAWLNVRPIGSTPLAGDPVNDYDAVTKRWVENKLNTGTVGPTMNGVMNYGVVRVNLDASKCSPIYGRSNIEIMGRNFVGVWVIRASGGFVAAKTSWSVINGDAVKPNTGTTVYGGSVLSEYKVGTSSEAVSTLRAKATIGGTYSTELLIDNKSTGKSNSAQLVDNGDFVTDRFKARLVTGMAWSQTGWVQGTFSQNEVNIGSTFNFNSILSGSQSSSAGYKTSAHFGLIHNDLGSFADSCWQVAGDDDNKFGVRLKIQPNNNSIYFYSWRPGASATYTLQLNAVSDSRLKHDIKAIDATKSIEVLKGLEFQSFVYNNDEKSRVRRGVIAQQVETIEPLYVKTRKFYNDDGIEQEQKELDTTPMLLDTMHVVQDLIKRIEDLEKELEQLKVQLVSQ